MGKPVNVGAMIAPAVNAVETVQAVTVVREFLTPGPWVDLPLVDGAATNENMKPQMRLNAGRVELRGQFARPTDTGNRRLFKIDDPAYIPEQAHSQPMAAWEHAITGRAGYLTVSTGGNGYFQPESNSKWNRGNFGGIWWPARDATARLLPPEEAS